MFVCAKCYDPKKDKIRSMLKSRGACEICHERHDCWDVQILPYNDKEFKPEKVVFT